MRRAKADSMVCQQLYEQDRPITSRHSRVRCRIGLGGHSACVFDDDYFFCAQPFVCLDQDKLDGLT